MAVELIPINSGQHVVTFVPKVTTDLPFFNLTYYKKNIPTKVKFEGEDDAGHPIRWEVHHNTSDEIGYAGVQAHEVWYLLIKPAIDASRLEGGKIPSIIPLAGMRECLRMIGWTAGGLEARELIKVLRQIAFAGVVADLWFPTGETDEEGKPKFKQVKGSFSRMSIYAIGEQHLSEDDLKAASFDYALEDIIYIKLDPFEMMIQEAQADNQKLIDNQYMFSVKPVARRWYELVAGKVYGTIKHKKEFFEVRYSWYMKRHHDLKKFHQLGKVTKQMKQVVKDHIESGFITKVECRKYKEPESELDFIIRFYIGQTAQDSVNRIKGYLLNKDRRRNIDVKRANVTPQIVQNSQNDTNTPDQTEKDGNRQNFVSESESESREVLALSVTTDRHIELLKILITKYQISGSKASKLVIEHFEEAKKQIEAFEFREIETKNRAGFLIKAIEEKYSLPEAYQNHLEDQKIKLELELKRELINNCSFCNETGYRNVKSDKDTFYGLMHECTHDEEIENRFEEVD
jgi:hypothetical protein